MKITRFLGFTDGIKQPRKTKVEDSLQTCYSYNGKLYNAVEFLCTKLLEGCTPEARENYQYYKRNGELSKPKTLYKYNSPDNRSYFELNKTQYDFVTYLIDKGLDTEEKMVAYDKADVQRVEAMEKAETEEKERQEEMERKRREEKETFKNWMFSEAEKVPAEQKKIIDAIFMDIYGEENVRNYSLAVCINNFDKTLCKEEIISRLHNHNKASIKIFECLSGLPLPKTYKKRIEYLETLTAEDFKEPVPYIPRKRVKRKEKELKEFYISERDNSLGWRWTKILAEPIEKYGAKMFFHKANGRYQLSLEESGVCVVSGSTKQECMASLKRFVDSNGKKAFMEKIEYFNKLILENAGKNPLYKAV